jgi:hypothetical protein
MYATSVFYSQIYLSLLPGRQFPNLASVYPLPAAGRPVGSTAYSPKSVPEEPYLADDVERFCICNSPDDGRPMVQCSNGPACLMDWFHLECIGMHIDEIPKEQGLSA